MLETLGRSRPGNFQAVGDHIPRLCGGELGSPSQSDPLLDVVGQTDPQALGLYFDQSAQPELAEAELLLDPRVDKLCNLRTLAINLPGFWSLHFREKSRHGLGILTPGYSTASGLRATLITERAGLTV